MARRRKRRGRGRAKRGQRKHATASLRHGLAALRGACARAMPLWMLLLLIGAGGWLCIHLVERSAIFRVQYVIEPTFTAWQGPGDLRGQSLLRIDLQAIAQRLQRQNSFVRTIRVSRHWPDTIAIEATPRHPVAQLRLQDYVPLDAEGYVFSVSTPAPHPDLPIVEGVAQRDASVPRGRVSRSSRIRLALSLLDQLRSSPVLRRESVMLVNVSDVRQVTFRLQQGIEVRVGDAQRIPQTLDKLGPVLVKMREENLVPRYIDLRFADPVIGPR